MIDTALYCLLAAFGAGMVAASALIPTRRERSDAELRRRAQWIEQNRIDA